MFEPNSWILRSTLLLACALPGCIDKTLAMGEGDLSHVQDDVPDSGATTRRGTAGRSTAATTRPAPVTTRPANRRDKTQVRPDKTQVATKRPARDVPKPTTAPSKKGIPDTTAYSELLSRIVKKGRVNYALLKKERGALDKYLDAVAAAKIEAADKTQKLGFYINAYNASTLRLVLDRVIGKGEKGRDIGGVLKVDKFFDRKDSVVSGERLSLNELEAKGRKLGDPRIHFAVNCASASCPVLLDRAYSPRTLEQDLDRATRDYFASPFGARLSGGKLEVSQILNWYAKDFGGKDGARNFVLHYAPKAFVEAARGDLGFLEYDWELNKQ